MKRVLFILVFALAFVFAGAQTNAPFNGALLWKVSGNGLEKPSYVFGTFHLFSDSFVDSIPGLRNAVAETSQIVGEIDMQDMAAAQMKVMQAAMLPEEEGYKKLLSEEEYKQLDEGLRGLMGAGLDQMGMMKPGMLSTSLAMVLYMKLNPEFNPVAFEGIDAYLQRTAQEAEKPIVSLETIEEQITILFDGQPQRFQMESLMCAIEHWDASLESMTEMIEDYRAGNLNKMYNDSFHNAEDPCLPFSQASKNDMLKKRNDKWIEKLPQIMAANPSLVAVGALHLAGEEGILYQLDKLGYKIEPVK